MSPQHPCALHDGDMISPGRGLRWHGPTHALRARVPPVVGAPSRSEGYGVVAPPRIWSRGIPNAARCTSSAAF